MRNETTTRTPAPRAFDMAGTTEGVQRAGIRVASMGGFMYRIHELGEVNGKRETKVYTVSGPDDVKGCIRSAVQMAEMLGETVTMGQVIVEPING